MLGILSRPRRERIPPLELAGGNGATLYMGGTLGFLLSGYGYVGELLELQQGCEGPFGSSRVKVRLPPSCLSGNGPHLAWRGEPRGFSRVATRALDLPRGP